MQSNRSKISTSLSRSEGKVKTHKPCYVDWVTMDPEMIANWVIKCNTLKHLHEKKKSLNLYNYLCPKKVQKKKMNLKQIKSPHYAFKKKNPVENVIQFSLAARNSFKEWLGLISVIINVLAAFRFLRGWNTLYFSYSLIELQWFCSVVALGMRHWEYNSWMLILHYPHILGNMLIPFLPRERCFFLVSWGCQTNSGDYRNSLHPAKKHFQYITPLWNYKWTFLQFVFCTCQTDEI